MPVAPAIGVPPLRHWKDGVGVPLAATVKVTAAPRIADWLCGCVVMAGAARGASTRTLSTKPKVKFVLSESDANISQYPTNTLLPVNVALVIVASRIPSIAQSTLLPRRATITSLHANPAAPLSRAPVCCG